MIHVYLSLYPDKPKCGAHYCVGINSIGSAVLVQLGDDEGQQARVKMTPEEAEDMANWILEKVAKIKLAEKIKEAKNV